MNPERNENGENDEARMEIIQRFYMGAPSTSPRSMGPTINSEAFMFLKKFFRVKRKKDGKPDK